jgi:hypothetical protein
LLHLETKPLVKPLFTKRRRRHSVLDAADSFPFPTLAALAAIQAVRLIAAISSTNAVPAPRR